MAVLGVNTNDTYMDNATGIVYCFSHTAPATGTLTDLNINMRIGYAGNYVRLGVYDSDGAGGIPGTLLLDAGAVDVSTSGAKTISSLSLAITNAHVYWLAQACEVTMNSGIYAQSLTMNYSVRTHNVAYGALPSPFGTADDYFHNYRNQIWGTITEAATGYAQRVILI